MEKETQHEKETWKELEMFFASSVIDQIKASAKRWFVAWLITLFALAGTNICWLYVFNSYEYVTQDGEGYNYYNSDVEGYVNNGSEN